MPQKRNENRNLHRPSDGLAGFHAEPVIGVPEVLHIGERWVSSAWTIDHHAHHVWEFYLQTDGESHWEAPGENGAARAYVLRPGGFFAVAPGVKHRAHERPRARHHFFYVAFELNAVFARHSNWRDLWPAQNVVVHPAAASLTAPFRQLVREVSLELPQRTDGLRLALDALVLEALRLFASPAVEQSTVHLHAAVARARELLDHQPGHAWKLEELARRAGISPAHLRERFREEIGLPPHQYLLQTRIDRARQLLRETDVPITQLARDLGFGSSQHFATTFKKLCGTTPQEFRKKHEA
jgi:AraC-like DNA-binding protein